MAAPSYEQLLRKGPQNGDVVAALDELRHKIVADGIPSNSDGMVNNPIHTRKALSNQRKPVRTTNIHLAHPSQFAAYSNRCLPRPCPPGRFSSLQQDPQRHFPHPRNRSVIPSKSDRE